jgi:hypothetical protein
MAIGQKVVKYGAAAIIFGLLVRVARSFIGRLIEGPPKKGSESGGGGGDSDGEWRLHI